MSFWSIRMKYLHPISKMLKRLTIILLCLSLLVLCGCTDSRNKTVGEDTPNVITDIFGNSSVLPENARVVSAYGSFAECWLLAGGELSGVTEDAVTERNLDLPDSVEIIGTVKDINLEKLVSLNPDYVILSADIANQISLEENLKLLGIDYGYFRVDCFEDYSKLMRQFCDYTGRDDLYFENVTAVEDKIDRIKSEADVNSHPSYLLMRVYSTGIKVKTDNIADIILKELGAVSIVDEAPSLLTDLSVEEVIVNEPDYIFVLTMGDEEVAVEYFNANILTNSAWQGITAVKNGNYRVLPKDLFHYKPNNRWDESYRYLAKVIYPEIFDDET